MNLEEIEQQALKYLQKVSNPLVRFDVLYAHLCQDQGDAGISRDRLLDFLSEHELFRVISPLGSDLTGDEGVDAGDIVNSPCVILETRIPTGDQLAAMMVDQLDSIDQSLGTAFVQARERGDNDTESRLRDALKQAKDIRGRLAGSTPGDEPA